MRNKSELSIARQALDEIEEQINGYLATWASYEASVKLANANIKEKYSEFDTRIVEKSEGS